MNLLGMLHTFERVTRPLGHDTDVPAAGPEAFFDPYKLAGATTESPLSAEELTAVRLVIDPLMQAHAEEVADTEPVGVDYLSDEDWVVPAICEVLADHTPDEDPGLTTAAGDPRVYCNGVDHFLECGDWQAWREHVAPFIAERLKSAAQAADRSETAFREMRAAEKRVDQAMRNLFDRRIDD